MKKWVQILTLVFALIGTAATSIQIFNYFRKAEIHGKIISQYSNISKDGEQSFLQKLSIFSKNKTFYLKDIRAFIKFPGSEKELECRIMVLRKGSFEFTENGKIVRKQLQIDKIKYLLHFIIFPNDQTVAGYVAFYVGYSKVEPFDYIRYIFEDYSGNILELKKTKVDLPEDKMFFDDSIWK